jgi:hypothetical protein
MPKIENVHRTDSVEPLVLNMRTSRERESSSHTSSQTISRYTKGINDDFDNQISRIETDPESSRKKSPGGQGGVQIFEKNVIYDTMMEKPQRQ